jgi:hypothetical protein
VQCTALPGSLFRGLAGADVQENPSLVPCEKSDGTVANHPSQFLHALTEAIHLTPGEAQ